MRSWIAGVAVVMATTAVGVEPVTSTESLEAMEWQIENMEEIAKRRAAAGGAWLQFMKAPRMRAGLYELAAGATDPQKPHAEDEIYHIVSGEASFRVGEETTKVGPGSVIYVAAGVEHRFVDIETDLRVLVIFAGGP